MIKLVRDKWRDNLDKEEQWWQFEVIVIQPQPDKDLKVYYLRDNCFTGLTGQFCVWQHSVTGPVAIEQIRVHTSVMAEEQVWFRAGVRRHWSLVVHFTGIGLFQWGDNRQRRGPDGLRLRSKTGIAALGQVKVLVQTKAITIKWRPSEAFQEVLTHFLV